MEVLGAGSRKPVLLELDLTDGLAEAPPPDPIGAAMSRRKLALSGVRDGLAEAGRDPRVRGLVARVGGSKIGLARVQELRDAVAGFRRTGRFAVAWAESFGELGPGTLPYYLATAFDDIWLQLSGDVGLTGVALGSAFLTEALEHAGVQAQVGQRHEYKGAAETFTERRFSPAARGANERIVDSVVDQLAAGIAGARGLAAAQAADLVGRGPLTADEALAAGLVDRLGYRDDVYRAARERAAGDDDADADVRLELLGHYLHARRTPVRELPAKAAHRFSRRPQRYVGLIHGHGAVVLGGGRFSPLTGPAMGADPVTAALRAAARDENVGADVFRVDSPGGSYVASDAIWRAVGTVRDAGKPVVVSMGNVAASGGYFVAAGADAIVAQPGTLTGSIGVFAGKAVTDDFWRRLGVGYDAVSHGAHARMFSSRVPYSDDEWALLSRWLDRVYDDFVGKVADGRRMSRAQVHDVARGRVWTGADAHERGLVDELGGISEAAQASRVRGGLAASAPLRPFPQVAPLQRLRRPASSESPGAVAGDRLSSGPTIARIASEPLTTLAERAAEALAGPTRSLADLAAEAWGPLAGVAAAVGLSPGGPLLLPGIWSIG
jgi:protease-4